jgi:hypothetical protein
MMATHTSIKGLKYVLSHPDARRVLRPFFMANMWIYGSRRRAQQLGNDMEEIVAEFMERTK